MLLTNRKGILKMSKFCDLNSENNIIEDVSKINNLDLNSLVQNDDCRELSVLFNEALKKSQNTICYLSVLMIAIDFIKDIPENNNQIGDDVYLNQVARILKSTLKRAGDLATLWKDQKFACILSDTDSAGAVEMAERIKNRIIDSAFPNTDTVTVSIGMVTSIFTEETSFNTLLNKADHALSAAIKMGGNQIYIDKY